MMSLVIRATGIGSWPGSEAREAVVTVRDLMLADAAGDEAVGLPYLPETPGRGAGADLVGRGAGVLADLPVQLEPSGWRLAARPGRDAQRIASFWREDLDQLAEAYDGYAGPLKVAVAGPWTLAASLELPRGERAVSDLGAALEIAASLAEGVGRLLGDLTRLVPGARPVLQIDEPSLPAVLTGAIPTVSGLGRLRAVDPQVVIRGLQTVTGAHPGETVIHCCHPSAPLPVLRQCGASWLALDLTAASPARWESVAATLEAGLGLYAGLIPTDGTGSVSVAARLLLEQAERVGIEPGLLARTVVSPACGLAGSDRESALATQRAAIDLAEELNAALDAD
jgi:methionine synthase II (cobalamin-independent)